MKTVAAACVLIGNMAVASKVRTVDSKTLKSLASTEAHTAPPKTCDDGTNDCFCPDGMPNHYPTTLPKEYTIVGKAKYDMIWDTTTLSDALKQDSHWLINTEWILQAVFNNKGDTERKFGFKTGVGTGGFLELTVPDSCVDCTKTARGLVKSSAAHTEFQYRSDATFTGGEVLMYNICLTPAMCKGFVCPRPTVQKLISNTTIGHTEGTCCTPRICSEEVVCEPATKWEDGHNMSRPGSTKPQCCRAKYCPADICDTLPGWDKKAGSNIKGSTQEECCVQKECMDYSCSDLKVWRKKSVYTIEGGVNVTRKGWGDVECCDERKCINFAIPVGLQTIYKLKDDAATRTGNNLSACSDVMTCNEYVTCPPGWNPKPESNGPNLGSTQAECCYQVMCSSWTCTNQTTHQLKPSPATRAGTSDDECCELRFCRDWKCSSDTKWLKASDQLGIENLDRKGSSDEECCEPIWCLASLCEPATSWRFTGDGKQGSTRGECCEAIYCGDYTCSTDDDNDGDGSAWYKRIDTNTYRWQGSTDEECCLPKYCSQWTTSTPTQWKRKKDRKLQGSSEGECYDQIWCDSYCCVGPNMVKRPAATTIPGSTDRECCINKNMIDGTDNEDWSERPTQ